MSNNLMNLFKHYSTRLFGLLSVKYPLEIDKEFFNARPPLNILYYMSTAAQIFIEAAGCVPLI